MPPFANLRNGRNRTQAGNVVKGLNANLSGWCLQWVESGRYPCLGG